jgi:hypothetical protein
VRWGVRSVRAEQVAVALGLVFDLSRPQQIKTAALDNCLDMFRESEEAISQLVEPCVEVKWPLGFILRGWLSIQGPLPLSCALGIYV